MRGIPGRIEGRLKAAPTSVADVSRPVRHMGADVSQPVRHVRADVSQPVRHVGAGLSRPN